MELFSFGGKHFCLLIPSSKVADNSFLALFTATTVSHKVESGQTPANKLTATVSLALQRYTLLTSLLLFCVV